MASFAKVRHERAIGAHRLGLAVMLLSASLLVACEHDGTGGAAAMPGVSASSSSCAGEVSAYHSVLDNDLAMGHVAQSVYDKASAEAVRASGLCRDGREAEGLAALRATKTRFGYR